MGWFVHGSLVHHHVSWLAMVRLFWSQATIFSSCVHLQVDCPLEDMARLARKLGSQHMLADLSLLLTYPERRDIALGLAYRLDDRLFFYFINFFFIQGKF